MPPPAVTIPRVPVDPNVNGKTTTETIQETISTTSTETGPATNATREEGNKTNNHV